MTLQERDEPLAELARALSLARVEGRLAVVTGEAGIGKTSVLQQFAAAAAGIEVLWGGCEALGTPRPLGPLMDMRGAIGVSTAAALASGAPRHELFAAVLDDLARRTAPVVVLIEDAHWADEATLDLLQYLGRRIVRTRALLVLTVRDDELSADHPLLRVLGTWPPALVHRISLEPLSVQAIATLAGSSGDAAALHQLTCGNPFFVTEVLATRGSGVPASVRDAVLARRARLSPETRVVIDLVSVVPSWVETALVRELADPSGAHLDAAITGGLLRSEGYGVTFRHELARLAVLGAMPATRVHDAHRRVLEWLLRQPDRAPRLARIVHHAEAAGDVTVVCAQAPEAARQAAAVGAHREAVKHYNRALGHREGLSDAIRAGLLEALAYEHYLTGDTAAAHAARHGALDVFRRVGDVTAIGRNVRWLSRLSWFMGHRAEADAFADEAIEVLGNQPESEELAMAFSNRSQLDMLAWNQEAALAWGYRAVDLSGRLDSVEVLSHALNNVGTARAGTGDSAGWLDLQESLRLALAHNLHEHAARAYTNLASSAVRLADYLTGARWLDEGQAYTRERDLDAWTHYMQAWRARLFLETGRWAEAITEADAVLTAPHVAAVSRMPALTVKALVIVRRGESGAAAILDQARSLATSSAEPQRLLPIYAALAETAYLAGRPAEAADAARHGLQYIRPEPVSPERDQLTYWLWKAGALEAAPPSGTGPFAAMVLGAWADAAAAWAERGCPYERGLAQLDGNLPAVQAALDTFLTLGAAPTADWARQRLRQLGATGAPRGRRPSTRAHPAGLTRREVEVLEKLAAGFSNPEIARRLFVSAKTVDHHVSAILGKLDVSSRAAAVRFARERGWLPH